MVNRLILFDTPRTSAYPRCAPKSRADGGPTWRRVAPRRAHTDLTTSVTTSFEDGDHQDVGDADRAHHQCDATQIPPGRPASRPFSAEDVMTAAAATLTLHDIGPEPSR